MATVYFGTDYRPAGWVPTGDWTDVGQWFSNPGSSGEFGDTAGTPLGRLPTQADDVWFKQSLLFNFPTTWTGTTLSMQLGSPTVSATGTWSGSKAPGSGFTPAFTVYSTSTSSPIISGPWYGTGAEIYGGLVTSEVPASVFYIIVVNLRGGIFAPTVAINRPDCFLNIFGGTLNANITDCKRLDMRGGTINGTVRARQIFISNTSTILNSPTIEATLSDNSSITGPSMSITTGTVSMPQTTLLKAIANNNSSLTLKDVSIPATVRCETSLNLIIDNSTVLGSFGLIGSNPNRNLTIRGNSTIAHDISSSATNCFNFEIFSGTFTNTNPWIFGSTSSPVLSFNMGAETYRRFLRRVGRQDVYAAG